MKRIQITEPNTEENMIYYIGNTDEISAMYKSMSRAAYKGGRTDLYPRFADPPKFAEWRRVYALCIDENGYFTIVNSDLMLSLLLSCDRIVE